MSLYLYDGERFRVVALHNAPPAFAEFRRREPEFCPPPGTGLAEVVATRRTVHTPDIMLEQGYVDRNPIIVSSVELAGFRTVLAVPMVKDCMSSEHFGRFAAQFKRVSGSSGLRFQAAIAC